MKIMHHNIMWAVKQIQKGKAVRRRFDECIYTMNSYEEFVCA